ncbi:MAG: WD40 repeat domain-containing protein [Dehalococcoidia bacterium]
MGQGWVLDDTAAQPFFAGGRHDLRAAAWRPGGIEALVAGNFGTLVLVDSGVQPVEVASREHLRGIAWRPDGEVAIVVGDAGAIVRYDGKAVATPLLTPVNLRRAAWRPEGDDCLIAGNDGLLLRWRDGRSQAVGWGRSHLRGLAWRPDGSFAIVVGNGALYRYLAGEDDLELIAELPDGDLTGVAWRPDGAGALVVGYRQIAGSPTERESVAWLVSAEGDRPEPAVAPQAGVAFVHAAAGHDGFWIVAQPVHRGGVSSILRWKGGPLEALFVQREVRLAQVDLAGSRAVVVGSPRAAFFRA